MQCCPETTQHPCVSCAQNQEVHQPLRRLPRKSALDTVVLSAGTFLLMGILAFLLGAVMLALVVLYENVLFTWR